MKKRIFLALILAISTTYIEAKDTFPEAIPATMKVGQVYVIHAPANSAHSSDSSVLEVSPSDKWVRKITVTAKKPGRATLSYKGTDGYTEEDNTIIITVVAAPETQASTASAPKAATKKYRTAKL